MSTAKQQTQTQTTITAPRPETLEAVLVETEKKLGAARHKIADAPVGLLKMAAMSEGIAICRQLVTPQWVQKYVIPLMNTSLGFKTDKNGAKGPNDYYTAQDLVDPIIECLLKDFALTGNEFNVIAGNFYGAQNGYRRKVREIPGLTDLEELAGEPVGANGNTTVRYIVRCKINGKPWELLNEQRQPGRKFTIRVNSGMGPDAIIGKAARKALKAAYEEITGTAITDVEEPEAAANDNPPPLPNGRSRLKEEKPLETPPESIQPPPTKPDGEIVVDEQPTNETMPEAKTETKPEQKPGDDPDILLDDLLAKIEECQDKKSLDALMSACRQKHRFTLRVGDESENRYGKLKAAWDAKYRDNGWAQSK